jgi:hypothetical protein
VLADLHNGLVQGLGRLKVIGPLAFQKSATGVQFPQDLQLNGIERPVRHNKLLICSNAACSVAIGALERELRQYLPMILA